MISLDGPFNTDSWQLSPMGAFGHPNTKPTVLFGSVQLACICAVEVVRESTCIRAVMVFWKLAGLSVFFSVFKAIYQVLQAHVDQEGQTENPKKQGHQGVSNGETYNQQIHREETGVARLGGSVRIQPGYMIYASIYDDVISHDAYYIYALYRTTMHESYIL